MSSIMSQIVSSIGVAIQELVYRLAPDNTPALDVLTNAFEKLSGQQLIVIADIAIRIAVLLLFATPRQIQLSNRRYETRKLLEVYDYIVGKPS